MAALQLVIFLSLLDQYQGCINTPDTDTQEREVIQRQNTLTTLGQRLQFEDITFIGSTAPLLQGARPYRHVTCDRWPDIRSGHQLRSTLGLGVYFNLAIDCETNQTRQIIGSLSHAKYNISLLGLPRVNVLLFDNVARPIYTELYQPASLIHVVVVLTPTGRPRTDSWKRCCIRSDIILHQTRTRVTTELGDISHSCDVDLIINYTLRPQDALSGIHFIVASERYLPFVDWGRDSGDLTITGYCSEILTLLADHFNFTYSIVRSVDGNFGSRDKTTGRWGGLVGMVVRGEADMALTGLTITKERSEAVDFTYPFWEEPSAVVVRVWDHKEAYFYKPLKWKVWLATLGCLCLVTVTAWLYMWASPSGQTKSSSFSSFTLIALTFLSTALLKGVNRIFTSRVARVVWMSFWLVALIIVTSYSGNLVAALATQHIMLPFRTLDELAEDNRYTLKIRVGGVHQSLLQGAKRGVFAKLWKKVSSGDNLVTSGSATLRLLLNSSQLYAYMDDKTGIEQYLYSLGRCGFRMIPEPFYPSGLGIALPKGSPYVDIISKDLISMAELGLYGHWKARHFLKSPCETGSSYSSSPILLSHVWLLMLVALGCLGVCVLVLSVEVMCGQVRRVSEHRKVSISDFNVNR